MKKGTKAKKGGGPKSTASKKKADNDALSDNASQHQQSVRESVQEAEQVSVQNPDETMMQEGEMSMRPLLDMEGDQDDRLEMPPEETPGYDEGALEPSSPDAKAASNYQEQDLNNDLVVGDDEAELENQHLIEEQEEQMTVVD